MSLFSFATNALSNVGKAIESTVIVPVGNTIANALGAKSAPVTTESFNSSNAGKVYTGVLGTAAVAAAAVVATGTATGQAVLSTAAQAAKSFVVANPVKTGIALAAAPVAINIVAGSPKVQDAIVNYPSKAAQFGTDISSAIENPSLSSISNVVKNNPVLSAVTVGAAAVGIGAVTAPIVASALNTRAENKNTAAALQGNSPQQVSASPLPSGNLPASSPLPQPIAAGSAKPLKKAKKKKKKSPAKKKKTSKKKKKSIKRKKSKTKSKHKK
jgi:hypothetical protein